MNYKVTIVEGLIGVGKSTLSEELGTALGPGTLVMQEPDEKNNANPYLDDFYKDMHRWAFTMQVHLLEKRWRMHRLAQEYALAGKGHVVLDRSYFGDTAFAKLQEESGAMGQREFATYSALYHAMTEIVLLPNVCVRLLTSPEIAAKRIKKRAAGRKGRELEAVTVDIGYLHALDARITDMVEVLARQGVKILDVPWDVDQYTPSDRKTAVDALATRIKSYTPPDIFLDLHRRTV